VQQQQQQQEEARVRVESSWLLCFKRKVAQRYLLKVVFLLQQVAKPHV
jgi:hypothetical protein